MFTIIYITENTIIKHLINVLYDEYIIICIPIDSPENAIYIYKNKLLSGVL